MGCLFIDFSLETVVIRDETVDDAVDRRKLGFWFLLSKQQFKASLEQFYIKQF